MEPKQGCFIGHRDSIGLEDQIYAALENLIAKGVTAFLSGGMGNFDKTCEKIAKELGAQIYYIPYHRSRIKNEDYDWYDLIHCPFPDRPYRKSDIPKRNQWLVDNSDVCLCHVYREGGAMSTLKYAQKQGREIVLLPPGENRDETRIHIK